MVNNAFVCTMMNKETSAQTDHDTSLPWTIVVHISITTRKTTFADVEMTEYRPTVVIL